MPRNDRPIQDRQTRREDLETRGSAPRVQPQREPSDGPPGPRRRSRTNPDARTLGRRLPPVPEPVPSGPDTARNLDVGAGRGETRAHSGP